MKPKSSRTEMYGTHYAANFNLKTKCKGFDFKGKFTNFISSDL